jgi:TolA-binding protein
MCRRLLLCFILCAPAIFPADKTADLIRELSRDIGNLHDQVDRLQKALDDKLTANSQAQAAQIRDAFDQSAKAMGAIADKLQKSIQDQQAQQNKSDIAIAGLGARLQEVTTDLGQIKEAILALTDSVNSLRTQMADLKNTVSVIQTPSSPPKPDTPPISASDAFGNANRDRLGGKLEIAQQEYEEFLKLYPNDAQAHEAQYRIGSIQFSLQQYDPAAASFQKVIDTYPESKFVPDSLFYKAKSLGELGRWTEAMNAVSTLRRKFPNHPLAIQAASIKPPVR